MLEKKTIIDQIEVTRNGTIGIRLALQVLEDGEELSKTWHRVSIEPGMDVDDVLSLVDADITARPTLKAKPIERTDGKLNVLKSIVSLVHTPDFVNAKKLANEQTRTQ